MAAPIYNSAAHMLNAHLGEDRFTNQVVCSMGADPIHNGHVRYIAESAKIARLLNKSLIVIVNGDTFLVNKKGYYLQDIKVRSEVISHLVGVDYVVLQNSTSVHCGNTIDLLKPFCVTNGGDRSNPNNLHEDEIAACAKHNTLIILGVGGYEKVESSSTQFYRAIDQVKVCKTTQKCCKNK